jgi:hypothetical protein
MENKWPLYAWLGQESQGNHSDVWKEKRKQLRFPCARDRRLEMLHIGPGTPELNSLEGYYCSQSTSISLHVTLKIMESPTFQGDTKQNVRVSFELTSRISQKGTYSKAWKNFSCHDCHHPPVTRLRSLGLDLLSCLMT